MSPTQLLFTTVLLSVMTQWAALKYKYPAIILLLAVGLLVGPITGWVSTHNLPEATVTTIVSWSVAFILFEGGLQLKLTELKRSPVIMSLLVLGALTSFVLTTLFAMWILHWPIVMAMLMGAILIVTGPTVILPMLNHIRPKTELSDILKWEGILNDPIGAVIAVAILEALLIGEFNLVGIHVLWGLLATIVGSCCFAFIGGLVYIIPNKFKWLPKHLNIPWLISILIGLLYLTNTLQEEAGLLSVTLFGVFLANQRWLDIRPIITFCQPIQTILISSLFIFLSAYLTLEQITTFRLEFILVLGAVIFIARPVAVWLSTQKTKLSWQDKTFISLMAPRGIVAVSIASIIGLELQHRNVPMADEFLPMMLFIIVGTIFFSSLFGTPLSNALNLKQKKNNGILFVGANKASQWLASEYQKHGIYTALLDTNNQYVRQAIFNGLKAYEGSVLDENTIKQLPMYSLNNAIGATSSHKINLLTKQALSEYIKPSRIKTIKEADFDYSTLYMDNAYSISDINHPKLCSMAQQKMTIASQIIEEDCHLNTLAKEDSALIIFGIIRNERFSFGNEILESKKLLAKDQVLFLHLSPSGQTTAAA